MRSRMNDYAEKYRKVKFATVDMDFWKFDSGNKEEGSDNDMLEKMAGFSADSGGAICIVQAPVGGEGEVDLLKADPKEPKDDGAGALPNAEKKVKSYGQVLKSWATEDVEAFIQQCGNGGDTETWSKIYRKPRIFARPSETKVVKAPARKGSKAAAGEEGLKKGGKEAVGRRQEETEDLDDDDDVSADEPEEEVVEDVEV